MYYILDDKNKPVEVDIEEYSKWISEAPCRKIIGRTRLEDSLISTVFMGLDHSYGDGQKHVLWETMIFGGKYDEYQERYCSHEKAIRNHEYIVRKIINNEEINQSDSLESKQI